MLSLVPERECERPPQPPVVAEVPGEQDERHEDPCVPDEAHSLDVQSAEDALGG